MTGELLIHMRHARAAGICAKGVRNYMKRHGLSHQTFLEHGLPESVIVATGEHFALMAVEEARKEAARGG